MGGFLERNVEQSGEETEQAGGVVWVRCRLPRKRWLRCSGGDLGRGGAGGPLDGGGGGISLADAEGKARKFVACGVDSRASGGPTRTGSLEDLVFMVLGSSWELLPAELLQPVIQRLA